MFVHISMTNILQAKTNVLKILADPSRYKILEILSESGGRLCVGDIAQKTDCTQSAVSHQLSKLESAEIIKPIRKGKEVCYILEENEKVNIIAKIMKTLNNKRFYYKN